MRVLAFTSLTIFAAVQHFTSKFMYIVPIAWLYVALMMAVAEATSSQGSVLGACITFLLYGVLPIALVLYFMGTPTRRRARLEREAQEAQAYAAQQAAPPPETAALTQTNAGDLAPRDLVPPVGKEP